MKKLLSLVFTIAALTLAFFLTIRASKPHRFTIGITQIVDHPSLNAVRRGICDVLTTSGYSPQEGTQILYDEAQGSPALATQIAQKFAAKKVKLIIAIATPSAQAVRNTTDIPLVFASVTDPVGAKIISSLEHPQPGITGTRSVPDFEDYLHRIRAILKKQGPIRLGVVLNYGEDNSVILFKNLENCAKKQDYMLVTAAVQSSKEVRTATESLIGRIDAFFLIQDNTVASALAALLTPALNHKVPVFSTYLEAVQQGALAGLAFDEYAIGQQTGRLAIELLKDPQKSIPVQDAKLPVFAVNTSTAKKLGIQVPQANKEYR